MFPVDDVIMIMSKYLQTWHLVYPIKYAGTFLFFAQLWLYNKFMADSSGATKNILKDIVKIHGAETIHAYFKFNTWFSMILHRHKWLWTVW